MGKEKAPALGSSRGLLRRKLPPLTNHLFRSQLNAVTRNRVPRLSHVYSIAALKLKKEPKRPIPIAHMAGTMVSRGQGIIHDTALDAARVLPCGGAYVAKDRLR